MVFSFGVKWFLISLKNFYKNSVFIIKIQSTVKQPLIPKCQENSTPGEENKEKMTLNKKGG